ncbi:MAG: J domain-containing protein [Anaerolineae bacterium]|jgi:curved DNA-binding protein CbpA|nr:J domain-containing protein [Anaerolineae bacterium]
MSNVKNYYEILGVEESASDDEIKQAFKTLASQVSGASDPRAEPLREAYAVLRDPEKRAKYDIYLQNNRPSPAVRPVNTGSLSKTPAYTPTPNEDAQKWEYLSLLSTRNYGTIKYYINGEQQTHLKNMRLILVLNDLGGQGWEMTGITTDIKSGAATYIFKRMTDKAPEAIKKRSGA